MSAPAIEQTADVEVAPDKRAHLTAPAWLQATPLALVFACFFLLPLLIIVLVSFWDYNDYEIVPTLTLRSYTETFEGCYDSLPALCTIFRTYLSTAKFCASVWAITLVLGFTLSYFLAFHVRSTTVRIVLGLLCTIPFWTSKRHPDDLLDPAARPQRADQRDAAEDRADLDPDGLAALFRFLG